MNIPLTKTEYNRISKYIGKKDELAKKINDLIDAHDEVRDIAETAWRDASQRHKLEHPGQPALVLPALFTEEGKVNVILDSDTRTAEWSDAHEIKRVAQKVNNVPVPGIKGSGQVIERKSDEEKSENGNSN